MRPSVLNCYEEPGWKHVSSIQIFWNELARAKLVAYRDMDRTFLLACCKDGSSRRPVASRLRATAKKKVQIEGTNLIENLVWIAQDPYMAVETLMDIRNWLARLGELTGRRLLLISPLNENEVRVPRARPQFQCWLQLLLKCCTSPRMLIWFSKPSRIIWKEKYCHLVSRTLGECGTTAA